MLFIDKNDYDGLADSIKSLKSNNDGNGYANTIKALEVYTQKKENENQGFKDQDIPVCVVVGYSLFWFVNASVSQ